MHVRRELRAQWGGGAIFVYGDSVPEITGCEFIGNIAVATSISIYNGDGAGIAIDSNNWVTVSDCAFSANLARPFYAVGDELGYGGGLWAWSGGVTVRGCEFTDNTANYGAGLMCWGPALVVNCLFQGNEAVVQPNDPYPEQGADGAVVEFPGRGRFDRGRQHDGSGCAAIRSHHMTLGRARTGNAGRRIFGAVFGVPAPAPPCGSSTRSWPRRT